MKRLAIILLLFLICGITATAQVQFNAKVSKTSLGLNERLRVDFEMNRDGDNFSSPSFDGFRVVGGPNQAISNSYYNGKRTYSKTYSYFLSPTGKGKFTIGQASIEIDGEMYKTVPVAVTVTEAAVIPKDATDPEFLANENVHLVAEVSKSNPFLNEAITVTYKMYVSRDVSVARGFREISSPKYADFWSQNIDNGGNFKVYDGKYKGEDYRYVIIRNTVLYPQKTGKLEIEPLTLEVPIEIPTRRRDLFGRPLMNRVNRTITAGSRTIDVKPLPLEGTPDSFSGAVGEFTMSVTTNKTTLDANESLELDVKINGNGNLKLFEPPKIKLPNALEVYEPEREENVRTNTAGMSGQIAEKYVVVPQYKGNYPIRPISFSYFDPKTETYKTIASKEILINVVNGPLSKEVTTTDEDGKEVVALNKEQFKYIKLNADLQAMGEEPFFMSVAFWSLVGGPLVLIPLFILVGRRRDARRADVQGSKLRKADKMARKYLAEAKKNMGNKVVFYEALERALHNYLKAKLNIETSEMEKERIATMLGERDVSETTVTQFIVLLKSCEFARYTPTSNVTMQQDYEHAAAVISNIDKQIR
jgi:hypothetical protein